MKKLIKETMTTGIGTMGGMMAVGALSNVSGMPAEAKTSAGTINAGLGLINVAQLAKVGMNIMPNLQNSKSKKFKW